ncbi:MAG TPA: XRE family transcriptional regulator [bacterium]|nr:XRE family transcriptional regulator [bacterium]
MEVDIKALRKKLNLTQEQLAEKIGVSWRTICRWENSNIKPSPLAQKAIEKLQKNLK